MLIVNVKVLVVRMSEVGVVDVKIGTRRPC